MDLNSCQLVVTGLQRKTINVPKNCTIDRLYDEVQKNCAPTVSMDELRLVYGGCELERGKEATNDSHGIPSFGEVFTVVRSRGGSHEWTSTRLPLFVSSLTSDDDVLLTFDPDVLMFDSSSEDSRIRMPCGHGIAPESLLLYCTSVLDGGEHRISCPLCSREWSFGFIRKALKAMACDTVRLDSKMTETTFGKCPGFQKCPSASCSVWIYRDPADVNSRVRCPLCKYEYCSSCLRGWVSLGEFCGNTDCAQGKDPRIQFLSSQPLKTIGPVAACPSVRACPGCGTLLEHREACKHMACKSCTLQFCFVCLKPYNAITKQWQCGAHNAVCPIAPLQTTLPNRRQV